MHVAFRRACHMRHVKRAAQAANVAAKTSPPPPMQISSAPRAGGPLRGNGERRLDAARHDRAGRGEIGAARDDDIVAPVQHAPDRLERLAAHDERLAHGDGAEAPEIRPDAPGQPASRADDAVLRHRHDDDDRRCAHSADDPSAASAAAGQAECRPFVLRDGAERAVEADRGLVPVEHHPFQAAEPFLHAAPGERCEQRLADALPAHAPDRRRGLPGKCRGGRGRSNNCRTRAQSRRPRRSIPR